jgi:hypothetical protein
MDGEPPLNKYFNKNNLALPPVRSGVGINSYKYA